MSQNFFRQYNHIPVSHSSTSLNLAWTGGLNTPQFNDIDFTNDGKKDLIIFDRDDRNYIPLFYNQYNSPDEYGYEYYPEYQKALPATNFWAVFKDINGDGKEDLFTSYNGNIQYHKNISVGDEIEFEFIELLKSKRGGNLYVKIFVNNIDIPVFEDVDFDGDIDILAFNGNGKYVELNENVSSDPNVYDFHVTDRCWGEFSEDFATNDVTLDDPACLNLAPPMKTSAPLHSGSTIALYDLDNDDDMDVLIGDVSFNNIVHLTNSPVSGEDFMVAKENNFPVSTPIDITVFPAIYFTDLDRDGAVDMIASPSSGNDSDSKNSVWFYKNQGTTELPNFVFNKNNALQDQMIDVGRYSKVRLFDYNTDGKMDIIVSGGEIFDTTGLSSSLTLLKNTGTISNPEFDIETEDFAGLSSLNLGTHVVPSFGDLDNDGKEDMVVGNQDGTVLYFKNNATNVQPWQFDVNTALLDEIDVGSNSTPQIYDINNDGKLDLIIANRKGELSYYKNTGSLSSPTFTLENDNFGDIKIGESSFSFADFTIIKENNQDVIYSGSYRGGIYRIENITGNLNGTFTVVDSNVHNLKHFKNSSPALYDFDNDNYIDMVVGHLRGGLEYFQGIDEAWISTNEISKSKTTLYPNPTSDILKIKTENEWDSWSITNIQGQHIKSSNFVNTINTSSLNSGLYFITFKNKTQTETLRFTKM